MNWAEQIKRIIRSAIGGLVPMALLILGIYYLWADEPIWCNVAILDLVLCIVLAVYEAAEERGRK